MRKTSPAGPAQPITQAAGDAPSRATFPTGRRPGGSAAPAAHDGRLSYTDSALGRFRLNAEATSSSLISLQSEGFCVQQPNPDDRTVEHPGALSAKRPDGGRRGEGSVNA